MQRIDGVGVLWIYLKMRFERGLCLGIRNAGREDDGVGLGPVENLDAAADARLAAERKTDLAADIELLRSVLR